MVPATVRIITRLCCLCGASYTLPRVQREGLKPLDHRINCEPCRRRLSSVARYALATRDVELAAEREAERGARFARRGR
jgi:hypothetical protein